MVPVDTYLFVSTVSVTPEEYIHSAFFNPKNWGPKVKFLAFFLDQMEIFWVNK